MRQENNDICPTTLAERALDRLSNLPGEIGYVAFRKLKRRLQAKAELRFAGRADHNSVLTRTGGGIRARPARPAG